MLMLLSSTIIVMYTHIYEPALAVVPQDIVLGQIGVDEVALTVRVHL